MILVRDVMQVKWGQMDQVLAALSTGLQNQPDSPIVSSVSRILTDLTGAYFTLIMETKVESMDAYWENLRAAFSSEEPFEGNAMMEFIESGRREFYNIEYEAGA